MDYVLEIVSELEKVLRMRIPRKVFKKPAHIVQWENYVSQAQQSEVWFTERIMDTIMTAQWLGLPFSCVQDEIRIHVPKGSVQVEAYRKASQQVRN